MRLTAMLLVGLCALAGCREGTAQESYDGVTALTPRHAMSEPAALPAEPIASEMHVPWTITLLTDGRSAAGSGGSDGADAIDTPAAVPDVVIDDLLLPTLEIELATRRPIGDKSCGVAKSRS